MAKVTVDFSEAESFEAIPDGEYACVIDEAELRESKSSDYPYINLTLSVAEGEHEGRKLWATASLHPKALWRTKELFENLGINGEAIDLDVDEDSNAVLDPEFVGMPVTAVVSSEIAEQGANKGKLRNVVDTLLSAHPVGAKSDKKPAAKKPGKQKKTFS
jgi:hypothetical protein